MKDTHLFPSLVLMISAILCVGYAGVIDYEGEKKKAKIFLLIGAALFITAFVSMYQATKLKGENERNEFQRKISEQCHGNKKCVNEKLDALRDSIDDHSFD